MFLLYEENWSITQSPQYLIQYIQCRNSIGKVRFYANLSSIFHDVVIKGYIYCSNWDDRDLSSTYESTYPTFQTFQPTSSGCQYGYSDALTYDPRSRRYQNPNALWKEGTGEVWMDGLMDRWMDRHNIWGGEVIEKQMDV